MRVREGRVRAEENIVRRDRNENIGNTTASDLKAMAQDMLRMGTHWAQAAQDWIDQRRDDMNERNPGRRRGMRSDRDIQSDFSGGGYDQVGRAAYRAPWPGGRNQEQRMHGYRGVGPRNYKRSDERIREDLNERLTEADDIDASGLSVDVSNGVATLSGTVEQRWMKHRAEDLADSCSGVQDVRNHIQVGYGAATGSMATGVGNSAGGASPGSSQPGAAATGTRTGTGTNTLQDTPSSSH